MLAVIGIITTISAIGFALSFAISETVSNQGDADKFYDRPCK